MAKYVFPAVFTLEHDGGFSITFPDLPGCYSQGETIADGIYMASDALALAMFHMEKQGLEPPSPSPLQSISAQTPSFVTYIACDTMVYRKHNLNRAVKKTLSIPEWMNEAATEAGFNFSQVLQEALSEKLDALS